ncbi:hypothetical protein H310_10496 [Aphanomyces invadans]|uniref:BZIP domain-containing protein n=1 Tax=Aphanomyces invadans TaxID=157072 RepID=A0A024TQQ2_9STRA|nr:hypothetical protein H310_10496 [Aphanomyces invadans]ETV96334.1 hypothetical protein H310_10496 [Aphanomyces invadans]|eukprot:XP_008875126.1 hypothetical protein H310_10496 [Aphanomyces invadans]
MLGDGTTASKALERRQVCNNNQKRYRARKKAANDRLAMDVAVLHEQTRSLKFSLERGRRWGAHEASVLQYFGLFSAGYDRSGLHDAYLRYMFSPHVQYNGLAHGIEPIAMSWAKYTNTFASIQVQCDHIQVFSDKMDEGDGEMAVVDARASTRMLITWNTITTLFPHLPQTLAKRLVGEFLHLPLRAIFVFDSHLQVIQLTGESNLVEALYNLLGSLDDVSTVVAHSCMHLSPNLLAAQQHLNK